MRICRTCPMCGDFDKKCAQVGKSVRWLKSCPASELSRRLAREVKERDAGTAAAPR